jgi:hypothetical protein
MATANQNTKTRTGPQQLHGSQVNLKGQRREIDDLLCQTARETLEAFREAGRLDELVAGESGSV